MSSLKTGPLREALCRAKRMTAVALLATGVAIGVPAGMIAGMMMWTPMAWAHESPLFPLPDKVERGQGTLFIPSNGRIAVRDAGQARVAAWLSELVGRTGGPILRPLDGAKADGDIDQALIQLVRDPHIAPGGYRLDVTSAHATIRAADDRGLFRGAATLWKMMARPKNPGKLVGVGTHVPVVKITDRP